MTAKHLLTGKYGEDLALDYLKELGWTILERNVAFAGGELDIVARERNELVVVEVRTRSEGWMQSGEDSVGPRKLRRLVRTGRKYVDSRRWDGPWRIDILSVTLRRDGQPGIERFEDVTAGGDFS
jgi:putative endonuclease